MVLIPTICIITTLKDCIAHGKHFLYRKYDYVTQVFFWLSNKPYPDPEDMEPDEMVQCLLCEDWFHCKVVALNMILVLYYNSLYFSI